MSKAREFAEIYLNALKIATDEDIDFFKEQIALYRDKNTTVTEELMLDRLMIMGGKIRKDIPEAHREDFIHTWESCWITEEKE